MKRSSKNTLSKNLFSAIFFGALFKNSFSRTRCIKYVSTQYAFAYIYILCKLHTTYVFKNSLCLRDFFFQCSPEMEVMTKTNSVKSVAYLGRVSPWRHENIERKKSSSRKWSLSPENGITDLAPIVLPSFVISISTALMASNGYLFSREYDKKMGLTIFKQARYKGRSEIFYWKII